jgi:hypothetical protein
VFRVFNTCVMMQPPPSTRTDPPTPTPPPPQRDHPQVGGGRHRRQDRPHPPDAALRQVGGGGGGWWGVCVLEKNGSVRVCLCRKGVCGKKRTMKKSPTSNRIHQPLFAPTSQVRAVRQGRGPAGGAGGVPAGPRGLLCREGERRPVVGLVGWLVAVGWGWLVSCRCSVDCGYGSC